MSKFFTANFKNGPETMIDENGIEWRKEFAADDWHRTTKPDGWDDMDHNYGAQCAE